MANKRFKVMHAGHGGWCEWIAPIDKGYLMKCCDCGLVHEVEFFAYAETKQKKNGTFTMVRLPWPIRAAFRARRARKR